MKKITLLFSIIFLFSVNALAQSAMTDKQVFEYVVKKYGEGATQAEIASELLKQGVDMNQLQRVRSKYQKEYQNMDAVSVMSGATGSDRSRVANGASGREERPTFTQFATNTTELLMLMQLKKQEEENFMIFGHDIFQNEDLTFEPNMNLPTPEDYILGPGDAVYIDVFGASQQTFEAVISPDGYATLEGFGLISLSGLTVKQASKRVRSELGARFESSDIKLTLGQTRTIRVNVMGEVFTPGTYTLSAFATVFHALYFAGGVNAIGTLRDIKIYRKGKLLSSVDIYDYILNGELTGNVRLLDDDVIIVGAYDRVVNIVGKIKRPMLYEMKENETMADLIKYAGGFAGDAYKKSVRVHRQFGDDLSVFNVDEAQMATFVLADKDSVTVDSITQRYSNAVWVNGAVFRPGIYQISDKIHTIKELVEYADGVREDAFLAHAVLQRMRQDRTRENMQINLEGILNGSVPDVLLRNEDVLLVPSTASIRDGHYLMIYGEVFKPGKFKYSANTTIEDLILQAGGLKESASSIKVDVARRIMDQKATSDSEMRAITYTFELRDGFVVDADPGFTLMPYDEVYVRRSPGFSVQENVSVTGEVMFAGTYTLARQNFRLSDVIAAAGGPTSMAQIKGARLERRVTADEKLRMQQAMKMALSKNNLQDTTNIKNIEVAESYYVGIDLEKALKNPGGDEDIVLHAGDKIVVPRLVNTVKINGEVMYPNTVGYISGKRASYYVAQAGGYSTQAKRSRAYIIYQNGKVAKLRRHAKPAPGCEIVVPAKPQKNNMTLATQWISISTSLATIATLVVSVLK